MSEERESGPPRNEQRWFWLALALAMIPLLVGAIALAVDGGHGYRPTGDHATNELRTSDVGDHAVLVGPYSRDNWSHPGPSYFYALAIPYRLASTTSASLFVGALIINGAAIAGIGVVARRLGGLRLALIALLGCATLTAAVGPAYVRDPWNPYLAMLPFAFLVFLSWAMTEGELWALPVAAVVATFVMQTHIAYLPLSIPLVAWGVVWLVVSAWRAHEYRPLLRSAAVSVGVLVLLWLPPFIEQVTNTPGNVTKIVRYFRDADEPTHSVTAALRVVSVQFTLSPEWIGGPRPASPFTGGEPVYLHGTFPIPLLLVAVAGAAVFFWRTRDNRQLRLLATIAVAIVAGVASVMRTLGPAFPYRLRWAQALGMIGGVVVTYAVWRAITTVRPQAERALHVTAYAALGVFAIGNSVAAATAGTPYL